MSKYYVTVNGESDVIGYYNDEIHSTLPEGAVEITEAEWQAALEMSANKFDNGVFSRYTLPLTPEQIVEQQKLDGIQIQGQMVSLNESNQNGLASISTMIDKAVNLGKLDLVFPIYISLENTEGKAKLVANNQTEFDDIFLIFGMARQQFFNS